MASENVSKLSNETHDRKDDIMPQIQSTRSELAGEDSSVPVVLPMRLTMTKRTVIIAWVGLLLVAFVAYLDNVTASTYTVYALSHFERLSWEGAMMTIQGVICIALQGYLAIINQHVHSFWVIIVSIALFMVGFGLSAGATTEGAFMTGFSFYVLAAYIIRVVILILASELSSVKHRATSLGVANFPSIVSVLGGGPMAEAVLKNLGWRWGYGLWTVVILGTSVPLCVTLFLNFRKTRPTVRPAGSGFTVQKVWTGIHDLDLIGSTLLALGGGLLLLPIPLEHGGVPAYKTAKCIVPTVIGALVLVFLCFWEGKFAKNPLFAARLFKQRTLWGVFGAYWFGFFTFMLIQGYMFIYMIVAGNMSISAATYTAMAPAIVAGVINIFAGLAATWTGRPKWVFAATNAMGLLGNGILYRYHDPSENLPALIMGQVFVGINYGGMFNGAAMCQAIGTRKDIPVIVALMFIASNSAAAFAGAISGGIWTSFIPKNLAKLLPLELHESIPMIMGNIAVATSFEWGSPIRLLINKAYSDTIKLLFTTCVILSAAGFLFSLVPEDMKMAVLIEKNEEQMKEEAELYARQEAEIKKQQVDA